MAQWLLKMIRTLWILRTALQFLLLFFMLDALLLLPGPTFIDDKLKTANY